MLLHYFVEGVYEIFSSVKLAAAATGVNEYDHEKFALKGYFAPKKNVNYETYVFRQTNQKYR